MENLPSPLIGSRIRQRRTEVGLKQADLAKRVNVSASYLNLIEHNKRRIGGKLLLDIANALGTEAEYLSVGAEAVVIQGLMNASAVLDGDVEIDRIQELAERMPGWATAVIGAAERIGELEQTIGLLSDRLANDPHLADSLHNMVSTVTAIRSSAAILAETTDIEPQWRSRFERNILEESDRLVDNSKRLSAFLGGESENQLVARSPREEFETFLATNEKYLF